MIDTTVSGSPGWWAQRLAIRVIERRTHYNWLDSYTRGENMIPNLATKAARRSFQTLLALSRTNYAELVVEAVRERMTPSAFRTGRQGNANGDAQAWDIWQANSLDADSAILHRTCLSMGDAYVIVGPVDDEIGVPLITLEDPREVAVATDPARKRKTLAAVKLFDDDAAGRHRLYLYLPGYVVRASARKYDSAAGLATFSPRDWEWDGEPEPYGPEFDNVVPVVRFPNRSDLFGRSMGEFEPHIGVLDRIGFTIRTRLEIATLQAFRQRAVKGLPNEDDEGNPVDYSDVFASDPGALWLLPEAAEMWESSQVDLTPIKQAIRDDIQDLAAVTRTPLYYLAPDAANGSAEGASLAREGLVFKTQDRLRQATESWERVMWLALRFAGRADLAGNDMEVLWESPERYSLAERYDAATKANSIGIPLPVILGSILQFSPQDIDRMQSQRIADQMLASVLAAPSASPVVVAAPTSPAVAPMSVQDQRDAADAGMMPTPPQTSA